MVIASTASIEPLAPLIRLSIISSLQSGAGRRRKVYSWANTVKEENPEHDRATQLYKTYGGVEARQKGEWLQTARDLVESNHTRPLTSGDPIIQRSCGLEPHTAAAEAGTWLVFGFFLLFFEPPDARHREGKMRMTTQAAVQWPRRTIYHGRLSRSEFHEGQVPLKASGSCSWCWYS